MQRSVRTFRNILSYIIQNKIYRIWQPRNKLANLKRTETNITMAHKMEYREIMFGAGSSKKIS
jgi:hypothetical protein